VKILFWALALQSIKKIGTDSWTSRPKNPTRNANELDEGNRNIETTLQPVCQ